MAVRDSTGAEGFELLTITQPLQPVATSKPCTVAGGSVVATFDVVQSDLFWEVTKVAVSCTSTTTTAAFVYEDIPITSPLNVIASSIAGNSDQDDCATPIIVLGTKQLQVVWTGCSIGAVGSARLQVAVKKLFPAISR